MNSTNVRFINALILILFSVLGLSGLYGLVWPFPSSLFEIHRIAGWALIVVIPWKGAIVLRSLSRGLSRRVDRSLMVFVSILLTIATVMILILVLMWVWQIGPYFVWIGSYAYSGIGWHWGIALGLAPLFILHVWQRWPRPKKVDFTGRRQALKLMGFGTAAILGWGVSKTLTQTIESTKAQRRFTGSRDQGKVRFDPDTWKLSLKGAVNNPLTLNYNDLLGMSASEVTATLDCTGGWYTKQTWRGMPLIELLTQAQLRPEAKGIILRGVLDYSALFTFEQAQEILLATHVGDEVLNHSHGFPLRAVVPSRRGWHWVKWLTGIEIISV